MASMTDFRALCAELLQELCCHYRSWELKEGYCSDAMTRAQAALLQSEPQGPTDEEAVALYSEVMAFYECQTLGDMAGHFARAVLARYARPAIEPQGPTDEDLIELFNENDWNYINPETFLDIARSVLELR